MAQLSTHVLDTARGAPAAGVLIEVRKVGDSSGAPLATATTNVQGRTDAPLVAADRLEPGVYELTFHIGDYFRRQGVASTEPPFLDRVVIRIGIAEAGGRYHIPLLVSPYGYTTYRGS